MKCSECDGKGFNSLGKGIRGIKKCISCRGKGEIVSRFNDLFYCYSTTLYHFLRANGLLIIIFELRCMASAYT